MNNSEAASDTAIAAQAPGRSSAWFLTVSGAVCLLAALVAFVALEVTAFEGYHWPPDSAVPRDGRVHTVDVRPGEQFFVWRYVADNAPDACKVASAGTAEPVKLGPAPAGWRRGAGSAGYYEAWMQGTSPEDAVTVSCDGYEGASDVHVAAPTRPRVLDYYGPPGWIMVGFTGLGVLLIGGGATSVLRRRRHARVRDTLQL